MNEFELINHFFKSIPSSRNDVVLGIGDDAALLSIPSGKQLLVTTDTLVAERHFLSCWDAFDIAYKSVMVNVSDIAAMGGDPAWLSLSLTLQEADEFWLCRFAQGLNDAMNQFDIALIGGDTTRGPLSITITLHGLIPVGQGIRRSGAKPGDRIYVSGELGAAALAVTMLNESEQTSDQAVLMQKLLHPQARVDLKDALRSYATSAIDISDGLSSDLNHICESSQVGACLNLSDIPIHPLVRKIQRDKAIEFALHGGDDYELCFTVRPEQEEQMLQALKKLTISCYPVGIITAETGLTAQDPAGRIKPVQIKGYRHF